MRIILDLRDGKHHDDDDCKADPAQVFPKLTEYGESERRIKVHACSAVLCKAHNKAADAAEDHIDNACEQVADHQIFNTALTVRKTGNGCIVEKHGNEAHDDNEGQV